jgi:endonuclease YncB( thermonuclease family)
MRHVGVFAIVIAMFWSAGPTKADLVGTVPKIYDGDTFALCDETVCHRVRICGINAPEVGEQGSKRATAALRGLVSGKSVRCVQVGNGTVCDGRSRATNQGRVVAQCFVGSTDIAQALVRGGFACDWVKFSGGVYRGAPCP